MIKKPILLGLLMVYKALVQRILMVSLVELGVDGGYAARAAWQEPNV